MKIRLIFLAFIIFQLLGLTKLQAQENPTKNAQKALADLARQYEERWYLDSLWAVENGWPLQSGEATFVGRQGQLPLYETQSTRTEIEYYYGQELWAQPYLLRGNGQTIGQWESPSGNNTAPDIGNSNLNAANITLQNASGNSSHATQVALRMVGTAQSDSSAGLGLAPEAQLEVWSSVNVESTLAAEASKYYVSNHSYASIRGWITPISFTLNSQTENVNWFSEANVDRQEDYGFGRYEARDKAWDEIAYYAPYHNIVLAASNERGQSSSADTVVSFYYDATIPGGYRFEKYANPWPEADGGSDGFDCLPPGTLSKNAWVIGATDVGSRPYQDVTDENINSNSAFGPTDDGRIKPDFVAPGGFTSYSAPQVSASLALLQELAQKKLGYALRSATLKALMMHSAYDFAPSGPDYRSGWGLINPSGAAALIDGQEVNSRFYEQALEPNSTQVYYLYLDSIRDLKASIAWTDPPATPLSRDYDSRDLNNSQPLLINDLNIRLIRLADQQSYFPFILNPLQPALAATTGNNVLDNAEQIFLKQASAGWYVLSVDAQGNLVDAQGNSAAQNYSLVLSGFSRYYCAPENGYSAHWNGQQWIPASPTAGAKVRISGNYTLSGDQYFGQLHADPGSQINLQGHDLHLAGDLISPDLNLSGGKLYFDGTLKQNLCGSCKAEQVYLNNSGGLDIASENSRMEIKDYLFLQSGSLTTANALCLIGGSGLNNYAQIHHESGGSWQGSIHFSLFLPASSASGWRSLGSPVNTRLGSLLKSLDNFALSPNGSVFQWNARRSRWEVPADTTAPFNALNPYWIYLGENENTRFNTFPFSLELSGETPTSVQQNLGFHDGSGGQFVSGSIDSAGWNLLSNPFPENLNWSAIKQHADFSRTTAPLHGSYYVWDPQAGKYLSHNGLVGDSELGGSIAPMQAFFVKLNQAADSTSAAFNFNRSHRHLSPANFRKKVLPHWQLEWRFSDSSQADRCYIAFSSQSSAAFDTDLDAYKLMGDPVTGPRIYSLPPQGADAPELGIQCLPWLQEGEKIALALKAPSPGPCSIKASAIQINQAEPWYLIDRKLGKLHALSEKSYHFYYDVNDAAERFWLWRAPTNFHALDSTAENPLLWYYKEGFLHLKLAHWQESLQLSLVNSAGQKLWQQEKLSGVEWRIDLNLSPGVYYLLLESLDWSHRETLYLGD